MQLNDRMENIGARRLQTVMTTLLEEVLFELPESGAGSILVDRAFVKERLAGFKAPRRFEFREELPKVGSGKIARHLLRSTSQARDT